MSENLTPQNIDAEKSVLGSVLIDNRTVDDLIEVIEPVDFYLEKHRLIYRAMLALNEKNEPIDLLTLSDFLAAGNMIERAGGTAYIAELIDFVPSAVNVGNYARIVRDRSIRRKAIATANDIAKAAYESPEDVDDMLDKIEGAVYSLARERSTSTMALVADRIGAVVESIEQLYERKESITGVATGYVDIDRITAGLQPSDLVIIAGRPGMGKTALALNIAFAAALRGIGAVVFSLEMSTEQLIVRALCSEARVDSARLRSGYLQRTDFPWLARMAAAFMESPIWIDDAAAQTVAEIRSKARRLASQNEIKMIVVDYLQLVRAQARGTSREQEISEISRSLKALAKELNVPVVALSQLNRKVEDRGDRRPQLSDLRESGAIEQDADVIMFIYRDEVYSKDESKKGLAEVNVAKQRNGPTGTVELAFIDRYTRFENYAKKES